MSKGMGVLYVHVISRVIEVTWGEDTLLIEILTAPH